MRINTIFNIETQESETILIPHSIEVDKVQFEYTSRQNKYFDSIGRDYISDTANYLIMNNQITPLKLAVINYVRRWINANWEPWRSVKETAIEIQDPNDPEKIIRVIEEDNITPPIAPPIVGFFDIKDILEDRQPREGVSVNPDDYNNATF